MIDKEISLMPQQLPPALANNPCLKNYYAAAKFNGYSENDTKRFVVALFKVAFDIGLKVAPDPGHMNSMAKWIMDSWPHLSTEDIQAAFDMAMIGKLNVVVEHFQSFDRLYVSRIIKAYGKFRSSELYFHRMRIKSDKQIEGPKKEMPFAAKKEWLVKCLEEFIAKGYTPDMGGVLSRWLIELGHITIDQDIEEYATTQDVSTGRVALNRFFDKVVAEKIDITELIHE